MERALFVYTTFPSLVEAEDAGRALVEAQLAACANIFPGMVSLYRWQGAVERAGEAAMILKTRAGLRDELIAALRARHPYETPAIMVIPLDHVEADYLRWLMESTQPPNAI